MQKAAKVILSYSLKYEKKVLLATSKYLQEHSLKAKSGFDLL